MASGCTSSSSTLSSQCLQPISDRCVKYTGPAIPDLGICTGDWLNEVENIILNQIIAFSKGMGIMISGIDLTACSLFTQYITCCNGPENVPKELADLIKIIFEALCALNSRLTVVEGEITDLFTGPYATACLSGLSANPTFKQIIQAALLKICNLDGRVTILEDEFSNLTSTLGTTIGNFLLAHVNSCQSGSLVKTGSGNTANLQLLGFAPIGAVIAFDGDLSMFDGTGLGRNNTSACGWALCNGNNGTKNMNGVGIMGTTTMGGSVNAAADGGTYAHGATGGQIKHTLTASEIPATGVTIVDNHTHDVHAVATQKSTTGTSNNIWVLDVCTVNPPYPAIDTDCANPFTTHLDLPGKLGPSIGSITGSVAGGGQAHENRSPYIAFEWIKRIA